MVVYALSTGQYPTEVLEAINKNNKKEGINISRIQQFTKTEQEIVRG